MFEKVSQIAEQAATNVSRRRFFGRFGRGAMAVAAGVAGLLVSSRDASARNGPGKPRSPKRCWRGFYHCPDDYGGFYPYVGYTRGKCPEEWYGCILSSCTRVC